MAGAPQAGQCVRQTPQQLLRNGLRKASTWPQNIPIPKLIKHQWDVTEQGSTLKPRGPKVSSNNAFVPDITGYT